MLSISLHWLWPRILHLVFVWQLRLWRPEVALDLINSQASQGLYKSKAVMFRCSINTSKPNLTLENLWVLSMKEQNINGYKTAAYFFFLLIPIKRLCSAIKNTIEGIIWNQELSSSKVLLTCISFSVGNKQHLCKILI